MIEKDSLYDYALQENKYSMHIWVLVDEILERHLRLPCLQWLHSVLSNEMFIEEDFSLMVKF
jgi:hypothetical protein